MEKLIKIAEITAESGKSAERIAEALENAGFVTALYEDPCHSEYIEILEKRTIK